MNHCLPIGDSETVTGEPFESFVFMSGRTTDCLSAISLDGGDEPLVAGLAERIVGGEPRLFSSSLLGRG